MTTSVKFLLQMQQLKLMFTGLHEYNYMTELHESWLFCSLGSLDRLS